MVEALLNKASEFNQTPFTHAHVCLITGEQGDGKSVTAVARIRDAYDKDCAAIFCRDILKIKDFSIKSFDRYSRMAKVRHEGAIKLLVIPKEYKLISPLKVFANFHLYGLPYVYCPSFKQIADWLKDGTIVSGYLAIDEYYMGGNARDSMTSLGKEMEKQSFQFRKMGLEVIVMCPMDRLADWTMRMIVTERIICKRNLATGKITLTIRKKGVQGEKELNYDPKPYYGNYWTGERINA